MSYRTNPDRILENIDRARSRDQEMGPQHPRQATGRELDTEAPGSGDTPTDRTRRIFSVVEGAYMKCAQSGELKGLASRFQSIGDIPNHHARGDVTVSVHYLDARRRDDQGMAPFEIRPEELEEARKVTKTSRPDVNALKILREKLRGGVMQAYKKAEPRIRESIRDRADLGHVEVQVTMDLRPAG